MKNYGILLIGCGHIGMEHLSDIYYRDNITIEAVADVDLERARKAARLFGAKRWSTDYKEFLKDGNIDIVIIATYTDSHLSILRDCLENGKHVLCEKPIASNLEDGEEFVKLVKQSQSKVLVAHILRHNDSYKKIKQLIDGGTIGELRQIRMSQNHHTVNWYRYCRLMRDCSPTVDCGVHYYDIAQWISGSDIVEVMGMGTKTQDDAPCYNYSLVQFKMQNGCMGYYESGWGQSIRAYNEKEFIGTKGRITLKLQSQRGEDREEGDLITVFHSDTGVYESINVKSVYKNMYGQLSCLIDMIENNSAAIPNIDEVYKAFKVAIVAEQALLTETKINVLDYKSKKEPIFEVNPKV